MANGQTIGKLALAAATHLGNDMPFQRLSEAVVEENHRASINAVGDSL